MRFDPTFLEDERWERLGLPALALHLAAVAYTVRTLSDGRLSVGRVRILTPLVDDPDVHAQALVNDGMWTKLDDGLIQVCQVRDDLRHSDGRGDEQPSKAFVEKERQRVRVAKEKWKEKRNAEGNSVPSGEANGQRPSTEQPSAVQDPKGPDPASASRLQASSNGDENTVPTGIPAAHRVELSDAPLGTTLADWTVAWTAAQAALSETDRRVRRLVVLEARQQMVPA